eukprot:jgi/Tetstr1/423131/TSEL_013900.t1
MAAHVVIAAAAGGQDAMHGDRQIDTHYVARVIQVELIAKTKTRVPPTDIINASRIILGDRREARQLVVSFTDMLNELIDVATVFADIDDFQSKLVECFHSNSNLPLCHHALRHGLAYHHLPGNAVKLAQHLRRTFDMLSSHLWYDEFIVIGVTQACLPNSA